MKKISLIIPLSFASVAIIGCNQNTAKYTVNFKNYNGTILETKTVVKGSKATYTGKTPAKPRDVEYTYTFSGWDKNINTPIVGNTDFVAQFKSTTNKYTVTFETFEGSPVSPVQVEYGRICERPGDPVKDPYTFVDWYTEDYEKFDFETTPIHNDITLYAGWGFTVKFEKADGTKLFDTQKIPEGYTAKNPGLAEPSDPSQYICYGWKIKDTEDYFDFDKTPITSDLTLVPAEGQIELSIEGNHNIDLNSSSEEQRTLHAYGSSAEGGRREVTVQDDNLVWKVVGGYEDVVRISQNGVLSVPTNSVGGTAYILAYIPSGSDYFYGIYEIEVAAFNSINLDSYKEGIVKAKNGSISGKLVIPSRIWDDEGNDWFEPEELEIEKGGFSGCTGINSVVIPESVTSIGEEAFRCIDKWSYASTGNIRSLTFKGTSKVKTIGVDSFDSQKLTSINIPASVTKIGAGAFYNCPLSSAVFEDQTNTTWNLTSSIVSEGQEVVIDIKDYSDTELAKGFTTYSWDDKNYGRGDSNWSKVTE